MPPRVLLSSVFKPFAVNDMYSRKESILELFHNQLTNVQGIYSIRTSYDTYGIHAIANNLGIPCTVLDFPTQSRFIKEIKKSYDYVGISSIIHNFQKVKWMVEQIRNFSPHSKIIIGGFCAEIPNLDKILDVDYICIGEGISFMRNLLGLPAEFKFKNPDISTGFQELMGVPLFGIPKITQIAVGLGCSYGCDFCSPSHFFGCRHIKFYKTGRTLFEEISRISVKLGTNLISFIGDDNFLIDLDRAEELRHYIVKSGKAFNFLIFASADKVMEFGIEKLAEMGVSLIWIGRESKFSDYSKNRGIDMKSLVEEMKLYGIKTILSSILLLDEHTKENIREDIEEHLACRPAFSQFSYYAPVPQTPLWNRMRNEGRLIPGIPWEEMHAFNEPWFYHPNFTNQEAKNIQEEAYQRDFHEFGPSWFRLIETDYRGWEYLRKSNKSHLRTKADFLAQQMRTYKILLAAMDYLLPTVHMRKLIKDVRQQVEKSFGSVNFFQIAAASIIFLAGRLREFRNRNWGDVIQPSTRFTQYHG
ncbi:MAG: hypothetical protein JW976_07630 [Syntrophaceae bacterium]|nr:hypothetical protein [Syntrophaceae bacterium]